jgi:hypothetical protein
MEDIKKHIKSVERLLSLIEDGILVRNTSRDDDFKYFMEQGLKIAQTIQEVQVSLDELRKRSNFININLKNKKK